MKVAFIAIGCLVAFVGLSHGEAKQDIKIERGTLGASQIMIATPQRWNRKVLMLAHGLRMENVPLTAEFPVEDPLSKRLLSEGWMIASTSFRRNGYIVADAVEDIEQLRHYIAGRYGQPKRVYVDGYSMGGAIVTQIAEAGRGKYDGALAIGAVLATASNRYTFSPQIPLLFVSNQNETADPKAYLGQQKDARMKPAFWVVKRDGHCNITNQEEEAALRALFTYREKGKIELEKEGTIIPAPPASVAQFHDGGASAAITRVDAVYGNFNTKFVASDLEKLGLRKGSKFALIFDGRTVEVLYGTTYSDVARGEWVAFMEADGYLKIARNFENAAAILGCKESDQTFIQPVKIP